MKTTQRPLGWLVQCARDCAGRRIITLSHEQSREFNRHQPANLSPAYLRNGSFRLKVASVRGEFSGFAPRIRRLTPAKP